MSRNPALVLFTALALIVPATAFAQLTPPAGSAGAGNAASTPPLRPSPPPPVVSYGSVEPSAPRARLAPPPYTGASQRITSARQAYPRKPPVRRRARPEVSSFTGICRGC